MKLLMLENELIGAHYVEPYAGGASVALSLLYEEFATHVHINDLDRSVHAFWHAALHNTELLCERIEQTPVTVDEWHRQRAVQYEAEPDSLDLAFSTFFMNRTNRSGIITGGVIGGMAQSGNWKLDARYDVTQLVARIRKVGRYRSRITLTNLDATDVLAVWTGSNAHTAFIYLDPPYYAKGRDLYTNFYKHEHHAAIAAHVRSLKQPWVVSYDAAEPILALYNFAYRREYSLNYSAAQRYAGSEVMFFSDGLIQPDVPSPAGVQSDLVDARRAQAFSQRR